MKVTRSSELSVNMLLILDIHDLNGEIVDIFL